MNIPITSGTKTTHGERRRQLAQAVCGAVLGLAAASIGIWQLASHGDPNGSAVPPARVEAPRSGAPARAADDRRLPSRREAAGLDDDRPAVGWRAAPGGGGEK
jgi:hypothetical protein